MRKLAGLVFFTVGIAFAVFAFLPHPHDRNRSLNQITEIAAAPPGYFDGAEIEAGLGPSRSFSPKFPLIASRDTSPPQASHLETTARTPSVMAPSSTWQTVVTTDTSAIPSGARVTSATPGDSDARYELVLSIQRDLKRAGCYGGALSGSWTASTRKAMVAFMESVNASLPVNEPDYILQTLLKGHAAAGCGSECPGGMMRSDDGHCVARSVIAEIRRPAPAAVAVANSKKPSAAPANGSGFTTTVRIAEANPSAIVPPTAPAPASTTSLSLPDAVSALPGRMSVGAARTEKPASDAPWRISIVPTPAPVAQRPPSRIDPKAVERRVAALPASEASLSPQGEVVPGKFEPDTAPYSVVPAQAAPHQGMPGTKSGDAVPAPARVRTAAIAPAPGFAPPRPSRRVYAAPRPKPARATLRAGYQTRSVRAIFTNPFGLR